MNVGVFGFGIGELDPGFFEVIGGQEGGDGNRKDQG